MSLALISLTAGSIAFVGTHFAMSHPLRQPLVRMFGEGGFMGFYSLVAVACMVWMYFAFMSSPAFDLPGSGEIGWIAATLITLPALVLFFGSLRGNPALPAPGVGKLARREPEGVFRVTRHPMMWGFALWALSHLILLWSWRTTIVASAVLILALVGARLQDRKKELHRGADWAAWEAKTCYWPRWGRMLSAGWLLWSIGLVGWLAITWWHIQADGIPAGIWRWIR
ncbi:MFS transporter [Erythrobacter litoralis]|uniref:NnrU family protein n=1 Tax=Erythrobacter litoralis TaxID=39960 RepID=UPI002434CE1C|nr:NnrU family protein [Erythrobacter litoralis]MDG6079374.1 MFS transporter [Erythrobacter litoralis]